MYGNYLSPSFGGGISLQVTNLYPGVYEVYLYGHGESNDENTVFSVAAGTKNYGSQATTNGNGWNSVIWQDGIQYVEFTNVEIFAGEPLIINAEPGTGYYYSPLSGLQLAYLGSPMISGVVRNLNGTVTLNFAGSSNVVARVWATTDLSPPINWQPIFTNGNVGPTGLWQFTDTNAAAHSQRFYWLTIP